MRRGATILVQDKNEEAEEEEDDDDEDEDEDEGEMPGERHQLQRQDASSSCEVSSMSMTVWSAIGQRLNALVCHCCERKLPEPENV